MNRSWIRNDHTSCVSAYDQLIYHSQRQEPERQYRLNVYLLGGQVLNYTFNTEEEQKKAYEEYKPK